MSTLILRSGDPRPWFARYLVATYGRAMVAYDPVKIAFQCVFDPVKKGGQYVRKFEVTGAIRKPKTPFVLIGVTIYSKHSCIRVNQARQEKDPEDARPDMAKHMVYCLWNVAAQTVALYNPLWYHQASALHFNTRAAQARLMKELPKLLTAAASADAASEAPTVRWEKIEYDVRLIHAVRDWTSEIVKGPAAIMIWYPVLILWDLDTLFRSPAPATATAAARHKQMQRDAKNDPEATEQAFAKFQRTFEDYYIRKARNKAHCDVKEPQVLYHPETSRCVQPEGKLGQYLQRLEPDRPTKVGRRGAAFNFQDRSEMSLRSKIPTFLDSAYNTRAIGRYLTRKYPHAIVVPARVHWRVEATEETLTFSPMFDVSWRSALADPAIKQIVTLMDLTSSKEDVGHANTLIYTKATNELEVFEPVGNHASSDFKNTEMYKKLGAEMTKRFDLPKLLTPDQYCPRRMTVFQAVECDESSLWDTQGYCAVWAIYYTETRIANPTLSTKEVVAHAMARLTDLGSFRNFIWNYDRWMRRELERNPPGRTPPKRRGAN